MNSYFISLDYTTYKDWDGKFDGNWYGVAETMFPLDGTNYSIWKDDFLEKLQKELGRNMYNVRIITINRLF